VAVFADKAQADLELERMVAEEIELRASARVSGKAMTKPNHWALAKQW
jgi:hypothetical protein